jgi:hypothetical protein
MPDHRDKPASALARGSAKGSDIERVRRDVDDVDARSVRAEEIAVARSSLTRRATADRRSANASRVGITAWRE